MKRLKFGFIICGILLVGAAKAQDAVYSVNIDEAIENGSVFAFKTANVSEGDTIILTIIPKEGYELNEISAFKTDHDATEVKIGEEEGIYSFEMPAHDVTITATFREIQAISVYSVNIDEAIENGSVFANKTVNVSEGDTIILTINPDEGYELNEISYFETDHKDTEVKIYEEEGIYSFKMPAHHVTVTAIFTKTETSDCELPEIQIVRKQGSAILICNISKDEYAGISYKWGYRTQADTTWIKDVEINGEMKTDSQYLDCQYIQFPENIIDNYVCIVQITKDNCETYGNYLSPKSSNSLSPPQITTYPNPTKNHLSLTLENSIKGRFTVSILNIYGQTVFSKQYTEYRKNEVLSLDFNLTAGMYLLTVQTKEEVLTSKIVIK